MKKHLATARATRPYFLLTAYGRGTQPRKVKVFTARQVRVILDMLKASGLTVEVVEVKKASHVTRTYRPAAFRAEGMVKVSEVTVREAYPVREVLRAYHMSLILRRGRREVEAFRRYRTVGRHAA